MSTSPVRGGMNKGSGHLICWTGRFLFVLKPFRNTTAIYWGLAAKLPQGLLVPAWAGCAKKKAQCDLISESLEKMAFSLHQTLLDFVWPFSTNQINISEQRNQSMHKTFSVVVLKEGNAQEKAFSISEQGLEHTARAKPRVEGQCPSQI